MQSRKLFLTPLSGLIFSGLLAAMLTWLFTVAPKLFPNLETSVERHLLLESFVTLIGLGLLFAFFHYFRGNPRNSALLLALGFLSFSAIQSVQILTGTGFAAPSLLPISVNVSLGLDLLARLLFSLHFLVAIVFLVGLMNDSAIKKKIALASGSFVLLVSGAACLLSPWRPNFVVGGQLTALTKGLEMSVAIMLGAVGVLLIREFARTKRNLYFWFLNGSILGVFVSVFFVSWSPQAQVFADIAHGLKVLTFATFCIAFFRMQGQTPDFRAGLEQAFKTDSFGNEFTFHELIERLPDGVAIFDKAKKLVFCNKAFVKLLASSKEDILGRDYAAFFGKQAPGASDRFEAMMVAGDGAKIPVRVHMRTVAKGAEVLGHQYFVSDLRPQKQTEEKLEELVRQKIKDAKIFEQCIEHSTEGLLITDLKTRIRYVNKAFTRMTGYQKDELIGQGTSTLVYDKRSELLHEVIWTSAREGRVWRGEFHTKKKDGSSLLGELSVVPIHENSNEIARFLWIEKDITRRKTLEKSLHQYTQELTEKTRELESSKAYYKTLISGMTDILIVVDNDNQCTFINESGRKRLNYQAQELTKQRLPIFFDDLKRLEKDYGSTIKVEIKDFEAVIKSRSGDSILCSWHARPLFDSNGRRVGAMAVGRDITENKKLQNELQEHAKNLEQKVAARTAELQTKVNQLATLLEIGEEIRLNTDIDVILNKICDAVLALGWKKVVVSIRDFDKRTARPIAVAGLQPKQIEEVMSWREIPFEHTDRYFKEAFRVSNSYLIPEDAQMTAKNTPFSIYTDLGAAAENEWRSLDALLVPIRSKDSILGVISVDDPEDRKRPGVEQIRDLEIFADKAALAIENARFVKAKKENERQTKFLAEVSQIFHSSLKMEEVLDAIVQKGGRAIGEFCSLLLVEDEAGSLVHRASYHANPQVVDRFLKGLEDFPARPDDGIIGSVVRTGTPYLATKASSERLENFKNTPFTYIDQYNAISSLMVTPLKVRSRI
ncbi:MAG: PAS domain S-box protein, partial [bacterium]